MVSVVRGSAHSNKVPWPLSIALSLSVFESSPIHATSCRSLVSFRSDCCDGSDEYSGETECVNTCAVLAAEAKYVEEWFK